MRTICHIVGAGAFSQRSIPRVKGDFVIAADGGYSHLSAISVKADMVIGDFDSLPSIPDLPGLLAYPPEKDETDMMLAVREGMRRGHDLFMIYGGTGGRLDHTLANIQTLAYIAASGKAGYLIGSDTVLTVIRNRGIEFLDHMRGIISVFCLGDAASGVSIRGLKYELAGARLTGTLPLGVSNEFTGRPGRVEVKDGTLLILWRENPNQLAERIRNEA
jgi:thiamine pyrophosphokinase